MDFTNNMKFAPIRSIEVECSLKYIVLRPNRKASDFDNFNMYIWYFNAIKIQIKVQVHNVLNSILISLFSFYCQI